MDSIILGLNVVIPLFIVMLIGFFARRLGLINDSGVGATNRLLFWIFLPSILFVSVYDTDIAEVFNLGLILFSVIGTTLIFLLGIVLVPRFQKERNRCGVIVQALIRGNEVYFGFPILVSLIGAEYLGQMSIVIVFAAITFNTYSVIALEFFKGENIDVKRLVKNIATNPMIFATITAVVLVFVGIHIPHMVMSGIRSISQVASPFALFLLGASFNIASSGKYVKEIFWVSLLRLFIIPGVVILTTRWMGFSTTDSIILFVTFGVPTAVAGYSMARELGADYELASQFVVFTSALSIVSIFLWTIILNNMGLL